MKTKHPTEDVNEKHSKKSKTNDGIGLVKCDKCDQVFGSQRHLDIHIGHKNHIQFEQFPCMYCEKVFPTQDDRDNHLH